MTSSTHHSPRGLCGVGGSTDRPQSQLALWHGSLTAEIWPVNNTNGPGTDRPGPAPLAVQEWTISFFIIIKYFFTKKAGLATPPFFVSSFVNEFVGDPVLHTDSVHTLPGHGHLVDRQVYEVPDPLVADGGRECRIVNVSALLYLVGDQEGSS